MVDPLKNRIVKEYEELKKSELENKIYVNQVDDNIRHWKGKINGPVS